MVILGVDTSTKKLSLSLRRDGKNLYQSNKLAQNKMSTIMVKEIDSLLKKANMTLSDVDVAAVGLGPGAFTGLRVGLSTIKGLAFDSKLKITGISSLDALAMNVKERKCRVCVLSDAKRGLVYSALYEKDRNSIKRISEYTLLPITEVLKTLDGEIHFIGDGVELYKKEIRKNKKIKAIIDPKLSPNPKATALAAMAEQKAEQKEFEDPDSLIPLYLYPDDCQVRK